MIIASYEIGSTKMALQLKDFWTNSRIYRFSDIKRILRITRRTSLIFLNDGTWVPLIGLTPEGNICKERIESFLDLQFVHLQHQ